MEEHDTARAVLTPELLAYLNDMPDCAFKRMHFDQTLPLTVADWNDVVGWFLVLDQPAPFRTFLAASKVVVDAIEIDFMRSANGTPTDKPSGMTIGNRSLVELSNHLSTKNDGEKIANGITALRLSFARFDEAAWTTLNLMLSRMGKLKRLAIID